MLNAANFARAQAAKGRTLRLKIPANQRHRDRSPTLTALLHNQNRANRSVRARFQQEK